MDRFRKSLILLLVIGIPAAGHSTLIPADDLCFASGTVTYRLAPKAAAPDMRVKFDNAAPHPDLRMQLVDRPEIADFVLADDFATATGNACRSSVPPLTVRVDAETPSPDVIVNLSPVNDAPDYKVYVHSVRHSHQDVAALLAAMWKAEQRRRLASRG